MSSSVRALLDMPWPQGKPHLCLGIRLVHLSSVTDFCLGTGDQRSPGTPLTFLRDHGVNGAVQEYPFFMLISFLFKENGPENSVILYNDTIAISQQGQTLPFDCTEKNKWKRDRSQRCGLCSFSISGDGFGSAPASENRSGPCWVPLSWRLRACPWLALPWHSRECPLGTLACSFLS